MDSRPATSARRLGLAAAIAVACLLSAAPAGAFETAQGWTARTYADDFPHAPGSVGPAGLIFDSHANLLVDDLAQNGGTLYRLPPGGGSAQYHQLNGGFGVTGGLAWDMNGHLYMARRDKGDVIQVDPDTGHYVRTLAAGMPCPIGLATDPISGNLFVSNNYCPGGGIFRIKSNGSKARYAPDGVDADGLTFAPDGTLYAAAGNKVLAIDGTNTSTPGQAHDIADVPTADGIAYAPADANVSGTPFLVVVRNDGEIDKVSFTGNDNVAPIVTGASRGDLVTVGPDRCIYASLQDRVIKLGPSDGRCFFAAPAQPGDGSPASQSTDSQILLGQRFTSRQQAHVADTSVALSAPKRVQRGSRFGYVIAVRNGGPATAHNVVVTDVLPAGARFLGARAARAGGAACSRKGRVVRCRKASLAAGRSFKVRLVVRAMRRGRYVNTVSIASKDLDPGMGNNRRRQVTRVT